MMDFLSALGDLPQIQTRKALLFLDFQNDFVRPNGGLHVPNTAEILEILPSLANAFRRAGDVVWARSYYESRQPLLSAGGQELVVINREDAIRKQSVTELEDPDVKSPVHEEAFLSFKTPRCCLPQTAGTQFPAPLLAAIDSNTDILIEKVGYSALEDRGLVLSLRTRFVTEIYICGSLSNVSVHATALDAVRHGFTLYLVEDCLGYRSFARHQEAMRRMADNLGANGITSQELLEALDWEETDNVARSEPRLARALPPAGIETDLEELDVKLNASSARAESPEPPVRRTKLDDLLAEVADDEHGHLTELAELTKSRDRSHYVNRAQSHMEPKDKPARTKMRRKRNDHNEPVSPTAEPRRVRKSKPAMNICRPGDVIAEGDSRIVYDIDLPKEAFVRIRDEVDWQKMYHMSGQVPRLVAVQGETSSDGSIPIYRHPADESPPLEPFTTTVNEIRAVVEPILGHPLNHVLIQLYRGGEDRISEHSDKTLDIVRGSSICNVSIGAQRVMVLRQKGSESEEGTGRLTQRVPMPHESLFVLGEKTNARWLHGIKADKRQESERSTEERAYDGQRISLTFRHVGTFLDSKGDTIWGQGAVSKCQDEAHSVIHGDSEETERLVRAFGDENRSTDFDWEAVYGEGFDVVNFVTFTPTKLVLGEDEVANLWVQLGLSENGIRYNIASLDAVQAAEDTKVPMYIDSDGTKTAGDRAILDYLAQRSPELGRPGMEVLDGGDKLSDIYDLLADWRRHHESGNKGDLDALATWEEALSEQYYLGGKALSIDDCALWPVLREIFERQGLSDKVYPNLSQYYNRVSKRGIIKAILDESK